MSPSGAMDSPHLHIDHWWWGGVQMSKTILEVIANNSNSEEAKNEDREYTSLESWQVLFQNTTSTRPGNFIEKKKLQIYYPKRLQCFLFFSIEAGVRGGLRE